MKGSTQDLMESMPMGTFQGTLKGLTAYQSPNYNTPEKIELKTTFEWEVILDNGESKKYFDSFITIQRDSAGYPAIGGQRAKFHNRLSACHGKSIVVKNFDWDMVLPDTYNSIEGLNQLPFWKDQKGEVNTDILLEGKSIIGEMVLLEFGKMERPDGTISDRVSIIRAMALPKRLQAPPQIGKKAIKSIDIEEEFPPSENLPF